MNAIIFDRIYNFSNIIFISENLIIEKNNGYGSMVFHNEYIAKFKIKYLGSQYDSDEMKGFKAANAEDLETKSKRLVKSYENFKNEFMKYKNPIINCDV
jgi:hypothetical protein